MSQSQSLPGPFADRLLISKADPVSDDHVSPAAEQLRVTRGALAADLLIGAGLHTDDESPHADGIPRFVFITHDIEAETAEDPNA